MWRILQAHLRGACVRILQLSASHRYCLVHYPIMRRTHQSPSGRHGLRSPITMKTIAYSRNTENTENTEETQSALRSFSVL